jgi:hypothetical protein
MQRVILSMNISEGIGGKVITELHKPGNAQMHHTSIMNTIRAVAPILARIVEEGIREGIYKTPYPLETTEFLFAASQSENPNERLFLNLLFGQNLLHRTLLYRLG